MQRCLDLAIQGLGTVSPNPMVGCVIVLNDSIIGEGYHQKFGGPHAEVEAIASVVDKSVLKDSTLYVSLEPCSHHGKTPPCSDLIIQHQIKKVVVGVQDPNPLVSGKGILKLQNAGIELELGILSDACRELNKRFFTYIEKKRPFTILKWAESKDAYMATNERKQISGTTAQTRLHKWRSEEDAFMIGTNTLVLDDPQLSTRLWKGKNPIRIAIDFNLRTLNKDYQFYSPGQRTIILNGKLNEIINKVEFYKIESTEPKEILKKLYELQIQSVVLEGGAQIIQSFIDDNCFDEIRRFVSKDVQLNQGLPAPKMNSNPKNQEDLQEDILYIY
jgi:diaminohydroxyphosphoribosylaminopyrimidine deaminase/5-amino-6-(5-phosphoribosylamino)uracil reductase